MKGFKVKKQIGSGGFSTVFLIENQEGEQFALKKIRCRDFRELNKSLEEVQCALQMIHPNIVRTYRFFIQQEEVDSMIGTGTSTEYYVSIVSEYCNFRTLKHYIEKKRRKKSVLKLKRVLQVTAMLVVGLQYVHDRKMIHRDLKPANLFLEKKKGKNKAIELRLGDFGFSKNFTNKENFTNSVLGSPCFFAPEIRTNSEYTYSLDVWGVGCILCDMLLPKTVDYSYTFATNRKQILDSISKRYGNSKELSNLVEGIMKIKPKERLSLSQILEAVKRISILSKCDLKKDILGESMSKESMEEEIQLLREKNSNLINQLSLTKNLTKSPLRFSKVLKHGDIEVSENGSSCFKTKKAISRGNRNIAMGLLLSQNKYVVMFKYFNHNNDFHNSMIGIADQQHIDFSTTKSIGGSIKGSFGLYLRTGEVYFGKKKVKYILKKIQSGDKLGIMVDLKKEKAELRFILNDEIYGNVFEKFADSFESSSSYVFVITMYSNSEIFHIIN